MADEFPDILLPNVSPNYYTRPQPLGHDLEHTVSEGIGGMFGCGTAFTALLIALALSVLLNWYLLRSFFTAMKDGISTLSALKEAIRGKNI